MLTISIKNNRLYGVDNLYAGDLVLINELFDSITKKLKKAVVLDNNGILQTYNYNNKPTQIIKVKFL